MIAAPWYLLAVGIVLVIVGALFAAVGKSSRGNRPLIDHRMRDEDIIRSLKESEQRSLPEYIFLLGILLIAISVVWRISRVF